MKKILIPLLILSIANQCFGQGTDFIYTPTCYGSQTTLVGSSSIPDADIQSWQWDIDGDSVFEFSGKTIVYLFASNDTFPVKLKVTPLTGTADSIIKNVIIDPLPDVNFHVDNLCALKKATYYNQSTITSGSIGQFLWDFDNNGVTDDNSNDTVTYTCGPAQTYITRLTCVSDKGCSSFATKTTEVFPQPDVSFTSSNNCAGDSTLFTNTSNISSPDFFLWDFGDGGASSEMSPGHYFSNAGNYNVILIAATVNGCRDTSQTVIVAINQPPSVVINAPDTIFSEGNQLTLTASGAISYTWWNGYTGQSVSINDGGTYTVTGTDANGCSDEASFSVTKIPLPVVSVASNILTPNGDNINDFLLINNVQSYNGCVVEIYNIWNDKVYSSGDYNNDWNCTSGNGKILPDGAYYYRIDCDGEVIKGNINILTKHN